MHPVLAEILILAVLVTVMVGIFAALIRSWAQEHLFLGPRRDEWQQARRQFRHLDQWRVIWATHRNHQVSRARLAAAQLIYVRYLQDAARRALLLRWRWLRIAMPAISGVLAAGYATVAAAHSQQRVMDSLFAIGWAIYSLGWGVALPLSVRRLPERMARLQAEIERAHGMPPEDRQMP